MAQGRDSAAVVGPALLCLLLVTHLRTAESATFTVGDAGGWTFNVQNWPNGKTFKAGDVLVFNYSPENHNVVTVDAAGYNGCKAAPGSVVRNSGNDRITINKGQNHFICSVPGHCSSGMKISVTAA